MAVIMNDAFPSHGRFWTIYGLEFSTSTEWIRLRSYTTIPESIAFGTFAKSNLNLYAVRMLRSVKEPKLERLTAQKSTHYRLPIADQPLAQAAWLAFALGQQGDRVLIGRLASAIGQWRIMGDRERIDFLSDSDLALVRGRRSE